MYYTKCTKEKHAHNSTQIHAGITEEVKYFFKTLQTFLRDLYSEEQYYKNNDKEQQTSVLTQKNWS